MRREQPYERMATYYDRIYRKIVDYEADCDFLAQIFRKHSAHKVETILDAGCGTRKPRLHPSQ